MHHCLGGGISLQVVFACDERHLVFSSSHPSAACAPSSPCRAKLGKAPDPAPRWLGNALAWVLGLVGPKGLEFAKYSVDYHYIRCGTACMWYCLWLRASAACTTPTAAPLHRCPTLPPLSPLAPAQELDPRDAALGPQARRAAHPRLCAAGRG